MHKTNNQTTVVKAMEEAMEWEDTEWEELNDEDLMAVAGGVGLKVNTGALNAEVEIEKRGE